MRGIISSMKKSAYGFTIVELLIVIVVIAILAGLSYVGYANMQAKARDSTRLSDIAQIAKALELYYADNGEYPTGYCGQPSPWSTPPCPSPKKINGAWSTTSDGSWNVLESALVPRYISEMPKSFASTDADPAVSGGYSYDYARTAGSGCAQPGQSYILVYRLESQSPRRNVSGECADGTGVYDYASASEHAVVKMAL